MARFDSQAGTNIDSQTANGMVTSYQNANAGSTKSVFYGKDKLLAILNQDGCIGINIYFAHIEEESVSENTLVLVGMDAQENDQTGGNILEMGIRCPPGCPSGSTLK